MMKPTFQGGSNQRLEDDTQRQQQQLNENKRKSSDLLHSLHEGREIIWKNMVIRTKDLWVGGEDDIVIAVLKYNGAAYHIYDLAED